MTQKERDKIDIVLDHLEKLQRGIYGDPDNNFKGLIERQDEDELRADKIERRIDKIEYNNKLLWGGATGLFGSGGLIYILWDRLTN